MITAANYKQKRETINFSALPAEYKQGDEFVSENMDLYGDDESIKKFIDLYIAKLNAKQGGQLAPPEAPKKTPPKAPAKKKAAPKKPVVKKTKKPVERKKGDVNLIDENLKKHTGKKGLIKALVEKEGEAKMNATGTRFAPRDRIRAEREIREIFKTEVTGKTELTTAEVIMVGRKINAQRSLYSQFMDLANDHKVRRWPTERNLRIWAKNPGDSDLIGVDTFKKTDATVGVNKGKSLNFWMM